MQKGFNFLKPQVEPPSQWSAIYDWMIGTTRIILMAVEIIVIVALGIRIVVDTYSKRLDNDIETYERVLSNRSQEEFKYRILQNKTLALYSEWGNSLVYAEVLTEITQHLPKDNPSISISYNAKNVTINGKGTKSDIDKMEIGFKNSDTFINTKLTSLQTGEANEAKFSLTAEIKELSKRGNQINEDL